MSDDIDHAVAEAARQIALHCGRGRADLSDFRVIAVAATRDNESLRSRLAAADALLREGCGYIDDVPDARSAYKDRVRAHLAAAREGEK
jgi:hypothetical protein